jgi:hypothetical protein
MISVILCSGSGDSEYNLHKRAALAFNCMAEILTDPADEIIFVDYGTPDDLPTLPEAIGDTLTERARKVLRVLRVRSHLYARYDSRTPSDSFEPVARNIAVRRASPSNPWILSTNLDAIAVPRRSESLSDIVRQLPAGFYHAAGTNIDRATWERFDRYDPQHAIRIAKDSQPHHSDASAAESRDPSCDDDFQLILRHDLFENHGFEEHDASRDRVRSRLVARLSAKYSAPGNIGSQVYVFVCGGGNGIAAERKGSPAENKRGFAEGRGAGTETDRQTSWGCASDSIEEIRLDEDSAGAYIQALRDLIGPPMAAPIVLEHTERARNKVDYHPFHLLPFLADMFVPIPRSSNVAWHGTNVETARLFAGVWERLGFTGKILLERPLLATGSDVAAIRHITRSQALAEADAFVFDFGGLPDARDEATEKAVLGLRRRFRDVVYEEQGRYARGLARRRIIALNAILNDHDVFVREYITAALTPFATHMRHGFVLPSAPPSRLWLAGWRAWQTLPDWLQRMTREGWRMVRRLRDALG